MEVKFEGIIKLLTIKTLVSLDKEAELRIRFSAEDDGLINKINSVMKADEEVEVTIKAIKND